MQRSKHDEERLAIGIYDIKHRHRRKDIQEDILVVNKGNYDGDVLVIGVQDESWMQEIRNLICVPKRVLYIQEDFIHDVVEEVQTGHSIVIKSNIASRAV